MELNLSLMTVGSRIRLALIFIAAVFDPEGHPPRMARFTISQHGLCYIRRAPWDSWVGWPTGIAQPRYGMDHPTFRYDRDVESENWSQRFVLTTFRSVTFYELAWPQLGVGWDPTRGYHALSFSDRDAIEGAA